MFKSVVAEYNKVFMENHAEPDFGECGSAVVLVGFGRKRKIKKQFEEAGLLGSSWEYCGKKMFVLEYDGNAGVSVPTQYAGYYRSRAGNVASTLKNFLEVEGVEGVDVYVHSWVD